MLYYQIGYIPRPGPTGAQRRLAVPRVTWRGPPRPPREDRAHTNDEHGTATPRAPRERTRAARAHTPHTHTRLARQAAYDTDGEERKKRSAEPNPATATHHFPVAICIALRLGQAPIPPRPTPSPPRRRRAGEIAPPHSHNPIPPSLEVNTRPPNPILPPATPRRASATPSPGFGFGTGG
jgi:hypothetical protein